MDRFINRFLLPPVRKGYGRKPLLQKLSTCSPSANLLFVQAESLRSLFRRFQGVLREVALPRLPHHRTYGSRITAVPEVDVIPESELAGRERTFNRCRFSMHSSESLTRFRPASPRMSRVLVVTRFCFHDRFMMLVFIVNFRFGPSLLTGYYDLG